MDGSAKRLLGKFSGDITYLFRFALMQTACAVIGYATAQTAVFDSYVPFGIAFLCASPEEYSLATAIGVSIGSIAPPNSAQGFRYLAAVFLSLVIKWIVSQIFKTKESALISAASALGIFVATGTVSAVMNGFPVSSFLVYLGEGFMAAGAAFFFHSGIESLFTDKPSGRSRSPEEMTSAVIAVSLIVISFSGLTLFQISPARIFAVILILAAADYGHEASGAIAGISVGLSMCMISSGNIYAALGFSFGGLMAGVFGRLGKMGTCCSFAISNAIIVLRDFSGTGNFIVLIEVLIGTVLYFVLPKSAGKYLSGLFATSAKITDGKGVRDSAVMRLKLASEALENVSETVTTVSEKLKNISLPTFEDVFSSTEQDCCHCCGLRVYCWETRRGQTLNILMDAIKCLKTQFTLSTDDLPEEFVSKCAHPDRLLDYLAENYASFVAKNAAERRLDEVRSVVSEQFDGISEMLHNLADEFLEAEEFDLSMARSIESALSRAGIATTDICCRIDKFGRTTAEIRAEKGQNEHISSSIILREIINACGKDFDTPSVVDIGSSIIITVTEKATLSAQIGSIQYNSEDNRLCGDSYSLFNDGKGHQVMMISDGMGCGGRAAVDGAMASGLMERLIKAGFGMDCALKIVNSAMLFKSTDESLATLDIACIDLFSGAASFFKAGAPQTIVCRNGKALTIESETLPAGILKNVSFARTELTLSEGDIIIMVSDGALSDGYDWIGVEAEVWKRGSAQSLAAHIADYARRRCTEKHCDDITVVAAIIEKGL